MKLALLPSSFHPHVGGVEQMVRRLAHELRRQGDDPLIVSNRWPKDLAARDVFEGLPVRRYLFRIPERYWRQMGGAFAYGPSTRRALCGALREHGTQLIHAHCISSNVYYALAARRRLGVPLVVTLHAELTMDACNWFRDSRFARDLVRRALSEADAVTACSARTLADAEAYVGHRLNATVIYNGADPDEFAPVELYRHDRPYLLAMGRLVRQKGIDCLLRAFALTWADAGLRSHDLLIAGDGPERASLEALAKDMCPAGSVRFLGAVARPEALALMKGCAFHVLPSRGDEGMPMVLLEAMGAGKASIASAAGGVPELVADSETGRLVPPDDVGALAAAIGWMAGNPDARAAMGAAARQRARRFAWPTVAGQYRDLYQKLLLSDRPKRPAPAASAPADLAPIPGAPTCRP